MKVTRQTVDLSAYPELVVIYLGMRANRWRGIRRIIQLGREIDRSVAAKPDGLLLHEGIGYGLFPPHFGMRQYWRDFESLERWSREMPHQKWWRDFLKDPESTGFWHETYLRRGGMECVFDNMPVPTGFLKMGTPVAARGPMFSARRRAGLEGEGRVPVVPES